jgi:hypothetical protein
MDGMCDCKVPWSYFILIVTIDIVAYLLKTRTVEPLMANSSETFVSRQWLGNHISAATDTHATVEVQLEMLFSALSVQRGYKEDKWGNQISSVWEAVKKRDIWKEAAVQRGLKCGS